eukprot:CAMPEP_0172621628 /NCGR_PEP_ID=MMETSP1068-20121228/113915_1 /TAXON_ID=35684 /ORGANISM="Pseudopedinella elastica, Strain CCMP716" /LENGTH=143 /DNA_ID=CAMNT_0013429461 /DNA_START=149 /DNA_END=580 /DNA_ORIENTATION=-
MGSHAVDGDAAPPPLRRREQVLRLAPKASSHFLSPGRERAAPRRLRGVPHVQEPQGGETQGLVPHGVRRHYADAPAPEVVLLFRVKAWDPEAGEQEATLGAQAQPNDAAAGKHQTERGQLVKGRQESGPEVEAELRRVARIEA